MRNRMLPVILAVVASLLIIVGIVLNQRSSSKPSGVENASTQTPASTQSPVAAGSGSPAVSGATAQSGAPAVSGAETPKEQKVSNPNPDLNVDANGLSKATVIMNTTKGVIKFKFYSKDAPNTVNRIAQLINQGFYNGLKFHRVVPGFVIQGGDPLGEGYGGSGQKLKAEFNNRRHIEGTVAMARSADPDSADSQFYISLGTHPHLDRQYTVFGQVVEGMDVAQKIQVGDKMNSVIIE